MATRTASFVLPELGDEAAEIGLGYGLLPGCQPCWISSAQEFGKGPYVLDGLPELRGSNAECFGEDTILPQQRSRIAGQPSGDATRRGDPGRRRTSKQEPRLFLRELRN